MKMNRVGMLQRAMNQLQNLVENRWANLIVGLLFFASGVAEIIEAWEEFSVGSQHGVALFGLWYVLRTIPEFFEAVEYEEHGLDE